MEGQFPPLGALELHSNTTVAQLRAAVAEQLSCSSDEVSLALGAPGGTHTEGAQDFRPLLCNATMLAELGFTDVPPAEPSESKGAEEESVALRSGFQVCRS